MNAKGARILLLIADEFPGTPDLKNRNFFFQDAMDNDIIIEIILHF